MVKLTEKPKPSDFHEGDKIPSITKQLAQSKINRYAEASGDFNPIHIDEAFAAQTPLEGTIAHGMLILAYASKMMTRTFGQAWLAGGKLSIRFKAPARPQDTITASGQIDTIETKDGIPYINCSLECCNQNGDILITGGAVVKLS